MTTDFHSKYLQNIGAVIKRKNVFFTRKNLTDDIPVFFLSFVYDRELKHRQDKQILIIKRKRNCCV